MKRWHMVPETCRDWVVADLRALARLADAQTEGKDVGDCYRAAIVALREEAPNRDEELLFVVERGRNGGTIFVEAAICEWWWNDYARTSWAASFWDLDNEEDFAAFGVRIIRPLTPAASDLLDALRGVA